MIIKVPLPAPLTATFFKRTWQSYLYLDLERYLSRRYLERYLLLVRTSWARLMQIGVLWGTMPVEGFYYLYFGLSKPAVSIEPDKGNLEKLPFKGTLQGTFCWFGQIQQPSTKTGIFRRIFLSIWTYLARKIQILNFRAKKILFLAIWEVGSSNRTSILPIS